MLGQTEPSPREIICPSPPITLTTDFGTRDHYVAQMKGAILRVNGHATIVDVTHEVEPQNVRHAAYLIGDLEATFPVKSVHVCVVDPGVGSTRQILAVAAGEQYYIAPDNGLLTLVLERHRNAMVLSLPQTSGEREISRTFHGRDLMAPAGALLTKGSAIGCLGDALTGSPVMLDDLHAQAEKDQVTGGIAWIDRFGNIITTILSSDLTSAPRERLRVALGDVEIGGVHSFYAEVSRGEPLCLVGSSGRLEIAVNGGSAAERYGVGSRDMVPVKVSWLE